MLRALILFICLLPALADAQNITGMVTDADSATPMANVTIENIYNHKVVITDSAGKFSIPAVSGELVEFHKLGYKVARVRIPAPPLPPFYRIVMRIGAYELEGVTVHDRYHDYQRDSLRNFETFKQELLFPKLEGLDVIRHPFSALSKRNQQIWKFQHNYTFFEQEKYIDYAFNEKLITNLTGLKGDSAQAYMKAYRPSYDMLHNMKEYEYYLYIKETAAAWRRNELWYGRGLSGY